MLNMSEFIHGVRASQVAPWYKNPPANVGHIGDVGLISGLGSSPGEGNGYPLQYSCLENPMDRGAWQTAVHRIPEWKLTERLHTHI